MQSSPKLIKDLVLIGGGHSHVAVLKAFGMRPLPGVRVTVVSPDAYTPYSGMLPGLIAGHYEFFDAHIDLVPLARFAGARYVGTRVTGIDPETRTIELEGRPPIGYDVLSINSGSTPSTSIPGAADHVVPVKPISEFLAHWRSMRSRLAENHKLMRIGIVGAGAGGVELALAAQHALTHAGDNGPDHVFELLTAEAEILTEFPASVRRRFNRILRERRIVVHTNTRVTEARAHQLLAADGSRHAFDEILWVTQASAPSWLRRAGLAVDDDGFMLVDNTLRSISHTDVFGAGDVATMIEHPRPKAGVFAVRQGQRLKENLRRALLRQPLIKYRPQRRFLSLISTGDRYAVASRGWWSLEGRWVWRWKNRIDRRFMQRFNELPDMDDAHAQAEPPAGLFDAETTALFADDMRCGGCGAKVGADVIHAALRGLDLPERADVVVGLDDPDDAAVINTPPGKRVVLTVDAFRPMLADPYVFGQITANHCLGDLHAMGAELQTAMALATLPVWPERKLIHELRSMLAGALDVFRTAGGTLVGGHTNEGAELSLGFALTGLIDDDKMLRKTGLGANDAIVLTKALGTGALFAADMRAKAKGAWIERAIDSMLKSNRAAAEILRRHGATACTDVTGFGLVGHLLEMIGDGALGIELELDAVPVLDGACDVVAAGIRSSLHASNARADASVESRENTRQNPKFALLFDPQTAGGLVAGIAMEQVDPCLAALNRAGFVASARIGRVTQLNGTARPLAIV